MNHFPIGGLRHAGDLAKQFLLRGKLLKRQPSWKDFDYDLVQPQMGELIAEDLWPDFNRRHLGNWAWRWDESGRSWEDSA